MPRLLARLPDPRPDGLDGTAGAREVEVAEPRVAMQVGKTKDGSEFPANLQEEGGRALADGGEGAHPRSHAGASSGPARSGADLSPQSIWGLDDSRRTLAWSSQSAEPDRISARAAARGRGGSSRHCP